MAKVADGVVVGSAVVEKIAQGESNENVLAFIKSLADGVHNA
jgi:tryptophan synthase alpha chain